MRQNPSVSLTDRAHSAGSGATRSGVTAVPEGRNFVSVHLRGVPELLSATENVRVREALVDHFEDRMPEPQRMRGTAGDAADAARLQAGTVGLRLTSTSVTAEAKRSQNRPAHILHSVIEHLEGDGPHARPALAERMRVADATWLAGADG